MHLFVIHLRLCRCSSIHISFNTFHKIVRVLSLTCKTWIVRIFADLRLRRLNSAQWGAGSIWKVLRMIMEVYWARRIQLVFFIIDWFLLLLTRWVFVYFIIWIIGWVTGLPLVRHTTIQCTLALLRAGARSSQNISWLSVTWHQSRLLTSGHTPFFCCLELLLRFERMLELHI